MAEIVAQVRRQRRRRVARLHAASSTRRHDAGGAAGRPRPSWTPPASDSTRRPRRAGTAIANVSRVAERGPATDRDGRVRRPRGGPARDPGPRAAVYVPGGRAPYPSTVVMGIVTARSPASARSRSARPRAPTARSTRSARRLRAGRRRRWSTGWAVPRRSRRWPTEPRRSPPVDVIVGPGNLYVQEAKRQVSGQVGIDGFAGPERPAGDRRRRRRPRAARARSAGAGRARAGPLVVGVSTRRELLSARRERSRSPDTGAVRRLVGWPTSSTRSTLAERFAPEHLELMGAQAEALAPRVTRAGCLFVGAASGTAFGDYIAGSNHVLPTNGAARFASALSPRTSAGASPRSGSATPRPRWPAPRRRSPAPRASSSTPGRWRRAFATMATMTRAAEIDRQTAGDRVPRRPRARRQRRRRARHRRRLPRPHARPAGPPRPPGSDGDAPAAISRPAPTTPSRMSASASARRSTGRSATVPIDALRPGHRAHGRVPGVMRDRHLGTRAVRVRGRRCRRARSATSTTS